MTKLTSKLSLVVEYPILRPAGSSSSCKMLIKVLQIIENKIFNVKINKRGFEEGGGGVG